MSEDDIFVNNFGDFLDLLHMFQYGIFHCAFDAWAIDAASEWMIDCNIKYKSSNLLLIQDGHLQMPMVWAPSRGCKT